MQRWMNDDGNGRDGDIIVALKRNDPIAGNQRDNTIVLTNVVHLVHYKCARNGRQRNRFSRLFANLKLALPLLFGITGKSYYTNAI